MTMNNEIRDLKQAVRIEDIIGRYVTLTGSGRERKGHCPFHTDKKKSLMVNVKKQVWGCFACGGSSGNNADPKQRSSGDVIDFLLRWGKTWAEIKDELGGKNLGDKKRKPKQTVLPKTKNLIPVVWRPLKTTAQIGQIIHYKFGKPSKIWVYKDEGGKKMAVVCRFDLPDKSKVVLPYTYCTDGTRKMWRWQAIPKNRPLYNLDKLGANLEASVMVVEGEKTADAAQKLFPDIVVTTWQGGANGVMKTDWAPLQGRKILVWPDNDMFQKYGEKHPKAGQIKPFHEQAGNAAMLKISGLLKETAKGIKWVKNSTEFPDKWDIADATNWDSKKALEYVRGNLIDIPYPQLSSSAGQARSSNVAKKSTQKTVERPPGAANKKLPKPIPKEQAEQLPQTVDHDHQSYFSFLGFEKEYDNVVHVFYLKETRTVVKYSSSRLARSSTLIQVAPLDFWEGIFANKRGGKVSIDAAVNWICRCSQEKGFFSSNSVRGRGAWLDAGRVVVHCGDKLIIDGKNLQLGKIKGRYVYEAGQKLDFEMANPLDTKAANKLMDVIQLLNFERVVDYHLLAGWCIVAPICGALFWRPHLWITGGAGSGKSWVLLNVVRRLMGNIALAVQSETSEAGLRQLLQSDALPIVFDEAEGEDERSQKRMQSVLTLMRSASAEDGGVLVKGSSGGAAQSFTVRSCFAFGSIGVSASQQSDRSRISILSLKAGKNNDPERLKRWEKLQAKHLEIVTDDFVQRLQARTITLIPTIIENARIFGAAAASILGEQRIGDQIGVLLAGSYSLFSNSTITFEAAVKWIKDKNWDEEKSMDEGRDEIRLLNYLLEYIVRVDTGKGAKEMAIGELVGLANQTLIDDPNVTQEAAINRLKRLGIQCDGNYVHFSNNSSILRNVLKRTPWSVNHSKILIRLNGAIQSDKMFFASGMKSRSVGIPFSIMGRNVATPGAEQQNDLFTENQNAESAPTINDEGEDLPF